MINDNLNEWEYHIDRKDSYKTITLDEVFAKELPLILISSIAGIGKTYHLQKCFIYWVRRLIWRNVNFIFYLEFKKLNLLQNVLSDLIKIDLQKYIKRTQVSSQTKMFVIDGLDEFIYLEELMNLGNPTFL